MAFCNTIVLGLVLMTIWISLSQGYAPKVGSCRIAHPGHKVRGLLINPNNVEIATIQNTKLFSDMIGGGDDDGFGTESEEIAVVAGAGDADVTEDEDEEEEEDDDAEDIEDDLDGFRLGHTAGLIDEDDEDDEDGGDDYGEEDEEEEEEEEENTGKRGRKRVTLKGRRLMRNKAIKMRKELSWEERFLEDPLKGEEPTVEVEVPVDPFQKKYVALAQCADPKSLKKRGEVWIHHMQWARRNSLLPEKARVDRSFTQLTADRMAPRGQVLVMKANEAEKIKEVMESEPIQHHGALRWELFELSAPHNELCEMNPVRDPFLMVGKINFKNQKGELDSQLMMEHLCYHNEAGRVILMGDLKNTEIGEDRYLVLFAAATKKDALRYLEKDPLALAGVLDYDNGDVSPVNEQDVDGCHHLMARSFAEKAELDPLHYMDPEDLFDLELDPSLVPKLNTRVENQLFLDELRSRGLNFRYNRYSYAEKYNGYIQDEDAQTYNDYMGQAQKTRLEPAVDGVDGLKQFKQANQDQDE